METKKGLLLLGVPALAVTGLIAAVLVRRPAQTPPAILRAKPRVAVTEMTREPQVAASMPMNRRVQAPPRPAPAEVSLVAAEEARIRGTFQNFRTAVATGNSSLQDSLGKVLRRDRDLAVRLAEAEIASARTERDRDIAVQTLQVLRR